MRLSWLFPNQTKRSPTNYKFGTFDGVFLPTLLTILGAVMSLRTGWVVGNAGLLGSWLIISRPQHPECAKRVSKGALRSTDYRSGYKLTR
jgi:hypothetical protein